jgi:predicted  nucleic acid-binding Zn-ribbon protein
MNERIEALRRLQLIDTKLKRLEGDKLYRGYDVQKKQNQIQHNKTELAKLGDEIKTFQKKVSIKELDLKSIEAEINKLRLQMNQVKTNKEYSAIKTEIGGKEADKSVLEDEILSMMAKYEEMQQRYRSFEKDIEQEELQLKEIQKQVETDLKAMEIEINELKKKHDKYASLLDQDTLQHYNRLVSHKDAIAVVNVVNKVCQGCFMSVTAQTLNQLMSGKDLTFCHSCGRILYLDSGDEEPEDGIK